MTSRERVRAVLSGEEPDRVPLVDYAIDLKIVGQFIGDDLPATYMVDAGPQDDDIQELRLDAQLALNPIMGRDVISHTMRPPVPATLGAGGDDLQFYHRGAIKSWEDLEQLEFPDLASKVIQAPARHFLERGSEYFSLMATRMGISASYLAMGMEDFFLKLHDEPAFVSELLRRYTSFAADVVHLAADLGFDAVWTADDVAGKNGVFWSPKMFEEIVWPHVRTVAEAVRETGISWICHSDGDIWEVLPDLVGLGISALNPIEPACMEIREVREAYPQLALFGNVDVDLLARGTPDQVRQTVRRLIRDLGPSRRYGVASGNSIPRYANVANVRAMAQAAAEFGRYPIAA